MRPARYVLTIDESPKWGVLDRFDVFDEALDAWRQFKTTYPKVTMWLDRPGKEWERMEAHS